MREVMAKTRLPMVRWEDIFKILERDFPDYVGDVLSRKNREKAGVHIWAKMDADRVTWRYSTRKPEEYRAGVHLIGEWEFGHKSFYYWPIEMPATYLKGLGVELGKNPGKNW